MTLSLLATAQTLTSVGIKTVPIKEGDMFISISKNKTNQNKTKSRNIYHGTPAPVSKETNHTAVQMA